MLSRTTIVALGSFLDTFQKIADAATNTKGMFNFSCILKPFSKIFLDH
jgi:hypothetical protein